MGSWPDGQVIDIPYAAGFHRELSPLSAWQNQLAVLLCVRP
jgi:hypothetical protein